MAETCRPIVLKPRYVRERSIMYGGPARIGQKLKITLLPCMAGRSSNEDIIQTTRHHV